MNGNIYADTHSHMCQHLEVPVNTFNEPVSSDAFRYKTANDSSAQPAIFYNKVLTAAERERLVDNITLHLKKASVFIQHQAVKNFSQVNWELGNKLVK